MPLGKGLLHPFEMVDLNVLAEIFLIQHRHGKDVEDVACHIDEGGTHKLLCLCLGDVEGGHHVLHSTAAHLRDQQIVEAAEHPTRAEQKRARRMTRKKAEKHKTMVEHCRTSSRCYCAAPSASV